MQKRFFRTLILLLLSLLTGGSMALSPLIELADEKRPFYLEETSSDSDDVEDSDEFRVKAILCRTESFVSRFGFHSVFNDVNQPIDWLFNREQAARAPPLG